MTWLPGGPEALPHRVLAHLFHHRSAPRWAPTSSGTCHALPPLHRAAPPSSTGTSSNAPLLQRTLPDCTSQASRPQAMCVPQYGATADLTWFSAPVGQDGLVSHPHPGTICALCIPESKSVLSPCRPRCLPASSLPLQSPFHLPALLCTVSPPSLPALHP